MTEQLELTDLVGEIRRRVWAKNNSQVADELGIKPNHLVAILAGRRNLSPAIARALGFEAITLYRRLP
jgi:plasmid maintenance system antidote protein VapI